MEVLECIKTRRSIRRFTNQPIMDQDLDDLLEVVRWSPSWANTQCWEVVVVRNQANKNELVTTLAENNPAAEGITEAPVVIVLCARKGRAGFKKGIQLTDKGDWYMFDAGIACQNLCLAAHSKGLGTVHVASFDHELVDKYLGLPPEVESIEIIPVGYPAKEAKAPPRKPVTEFVFNEKYGQ